MRSLIIRRSCSAKSHPNGTIRPITERFVASGAPDSEHRC